MTTEKEAFFEKHKAFIGALIRSENAMRKRLLTESDIDMAVDEMMAIEAAGGRVQSYKFPHEEMQSSLVMAPKPISKRFQFEIAECSNGFLLSQGEKRFIFKTSKELLRIFNEVLFEAKN